MNPRLALVALAFAVPASVVLAQAGDGDWSGCDAVLARIHPPAFPDREFSAASFGAVADGRTDCRAALARAIEACAAAGGGRVTLAAGVYFCDGPVVLKSGVDLDLAEEATLRFGPDPASYFPLVLTRYEGTLCWGQCPRIYAHGASRVAVTGAGTIDANGRASVALMRSRKELAAPGELPRLAAKGVPVDRRIFGRGRWLRSEAVEFVECTDVLVRGVTILDSPFWVIHPALCRNVVVRGVKVDSMNGNNDGCDPDSSADVLIENCDFHTGDDAVAIKSGRDEEGRAIGRPAEGIVVRGCVMRAHWGGICIGSEMSGGVRDVWVQDCRVGEASSALYFKGNLDRGGVVERVRVRRISAGDMRAAAIRFETGYHGYGGGRHPPVFRDFRIEELSCAHSGAYGLYFEGAEAEPVRDVVIRRVDVGAAAAPIWLRGAEGIRLEDVRVNGAILPAEPSATPPGAAKLKIDS